MTCLYDSWESWNEEFFDGVLVVPSIFLAEPKTPPALADCTSVSVLGSRSQIRIRPALLIGNHKCINPDTPMEGRILFLADILLHEMIHQWQEEVLGNDEGSYKGHGPKFVGKCNAIGALLGLAEVRVAKARGKNKDMPSCAHWPHKVRPTNYYMGAYVPEIEEVKKEKEGENGGDDDNEEIDEGIDVVDDLVERFSRLPDDSRLQFLNKIKALMKKR
ncbi:MAG: hypothetical protein JNN15_10560 [Blastocatellia bacterium]|nr:hypothetical protein [Blastocatellia bacterium]